MDEESSASEGTPTLDSTSQLATFIVARKPNGFPSLTQHELPRGERETPREVESVKHRLKSLVDAPRQTEVER